MNKEYQEIRQEGKNSAEKAFIPFGGLEDSLSCSYRQDYNYKLRGEAK